MKNTAVNTHNDLLYMHSKTGRTELKNNPVDRMKRFFCVILFFLFAYPAIRPLISSGYFPMHDDTQVARVIEMGKALRNGQFPVRWVGDLGYGYGYPIYNFYGPLPYYVGGILYVFGIPAVLATKIMFGIGIIFPSLLLFFVLSSFLDPSVALLSATALLYAPYHAVQIYVRGAVGEYWVMGFWPLILYGYLSEEHKRTAHWKFLLGSIGVAGAVLSHTLLGYVTVLFVFLMSAILAVYRIKKGTIRLFWHESFIPVYGLLLSAFFWLPAFFEMQYTNVQGQVSATANYHDHFVCLSQLWSSNWGYAGSAKGCIDGLSFMLGKLQLLLAIIGIGLGLVTRPSKITKIALGIALFGVFFSLPYSEVFWNIFPQFSYLQYPWRFLSFAMFGISVLVGYSIMIVPPRFRIFVGGTIALCLVFVSMKWFVPQYVIERPSSAYETSDDIRWRVSKISDEYLPPTLSKPTTKEEVVSATIASTGNLTVTVVRETETEGKYIVHAVTDTVLTLNKAYFPGWKFTVNGKKVRPTIVHGLPTIPVSVGESIIESRFTDTPIRIFGNVISLLSLVGLGIILYGTKRKTIR